MRCFLLLMASVLLFNAAGCSNDQGKQQLETARFEEKQNNREHAIKLYEEIVSKYPGSPNAKIARESLDRLKDGR